MPYISRKWTLIILFALAAIQTKDPAAADQLLKINNSDIIRARLNRESTDNRMLFLNQYTLSTDYLRAKAAPTGQSPLKIDPERIYRNELLKKIRLNEAQLAELNTCQKSINRQDETSKNSTDDFRSATRNVLDTCFNKTETSKIDKNIMLLFKNNAQICAGYKINNAIYSAKHCFDDMPSENAPEYIFRSISNAEENKEVSRKDIEDGMNPHLNPLSNNDIIAFATSATSDTQSTNPTHLYAFFKEEGTADITPFDASRMPTCRPIHIEGNCLYHGCPSYGSMSGSPLFTTHQNDRIIAIHVGSNNVDRHQCNKTFNSTLNVAIIINKRSASP